jgi:hypothetical protein
MTAVVTERLRRHQHALIEHPRNLARGAHVHIRKGNGRYCIGGGYNKSDGDGMARILREHTGKPDLEEFFFELRGDSKQGPSEGT